MQALNRKLVRDLWQIKGQAAAIGLVIAAGVTMLTMYASTFRSLAETRATYYERYRFADVFAGLKRAPLSVAERAAEIRGVDRVEPRVVVDVTLDVEGFAQPATGRLLSIPERRRSMLNDVFLRRGRYIEPGRPDEVLVHEAFAEAHGLEPGDRVAAVINGRRRLLEIVGVALSPEFIYAIRPGDLLPDDRRFGVFWMGRRALATAFDMEGGFNHLSLRLSRGASSEAVISTLDRLLERYGGLGAISRELQSSHWVVDKELQEMQTMGSVLPAIFLAVAAFLLNVVLGRIIAVQRTQIAALKAVGYSNLAIGWHYTKLSLLIALLGALVGILAGARLGWGMTALYCRYFRFPISLFLLSPPTVLGAIGVSLGAAALGAIGAVRRAVALPPAEAMRPQPPGTFRRTWIERWGLDRVLSEPARMIVRNIRRRPLRFFLSAVGVAAAMALLILGLFFLDAVDLLMHVQFEVAQRHDVAVAFVEPTSPRALHEVARLPGVLDAEPFRVVPARLRAGNRSRQVGLLGLPAEPRLNRPIDRRSGPVKMPPEGLVLTAKLGELLAVGVGDLLTVEVLEGARPVRVVAVAALVEEMMGLSAYMEIGALRRLLREGKVLSGAFLAVDQAAVEPLYQQLKTTPGVASVGLTTAALESFQQTLAQNLGLMIAFNIFFAAIIACGVVYNSARVSLSEWQRDLASLRVLGFTRAEISFILLGELAVVTLAALPLGVLFGYGLAGLTLAALANELYRIPLVIEPSSYGWSAIIILVTSMLSGLVVRRRLDRLDLVAVLKTRE